MGMVSLNGRLIARQSAEIRVDDRGFLLGDGLFETMRFVGGRVRRWPRHVQRLVKGLNFLGMEPRLAEGLEDQIKHLVETNRLSDAVVRLTITRGLGGGGLSPDRKIRPNILITAVARPVVLKALDLIVFEEPVRAGLPSEQFKLTQYGALQRARNYAVEAGADMAAICNLDGELACADCANLFWIKDDEVFTPSLTTGALPGTCRAAVIDACQAAGIEIKQVHRCVDALCEAEAVFVSNAVMGLVSVSRIDGMRFDQEHRIFERIQSLEASAD